MSALHYYTPTVRRVIDLLDAGATAEALTTAQQASTSAGEHEATMLLCMGATAHCVRGEPLPGLRMADKAHRQATRIGEPLLVAEAKQALTFALQTLDKHALAIDLANECERIGSEHIDFELVARAWRALGISMSVLGRHGVAIDYLQRAVALFEEHGYWRTRTLHAKYSLLNARSRALSTEASDIVSEKFAALNDDWEEFTLTLAMGDHGRLHAMALGNAAISARRVGRPQRALEQFRLALALQTTMQLHAHCAMTECHMGSVLAELGHIDDAIAAYERGIALFHNGNPRSFAQALDDYSTLLEKAGRTGDALRALRRSRDIERGLNDQAGHAAVTRIEHDNEIANLSTQWIRLAEEDSLTKLPNRRAFDQRLTELVARAGEAKAQFSLAFLDVDFFKQINDRFGHGVGDQVLREVGTTVRRTLPKAAFAARIGGEEFAVLYSALDSGAAKAYAEQLVEAIRKVDWPTFSSGLSVTVSAGLVASGEFTAAGETLDTSSLLTRADERLYRAKRSGRDRVCDG